MNIKPNHSRPQTPIKSQEQTTFAQAEKLLEQGKLEDAQALLTENKTLAASPRAQALLGASYYRQEQYAAAADAFRP